MDGIEFRVAVVLPAAGCGVRFGANVPKQFQEIENIPLLSYTIRAFEAVPWVGNIVVVVSALWKKWTESLLNKFHDTGRVRVVEGKETRHRSIMCGVKALEEASEPPDVVVIHDAVRPFIDQPTLQKIVSAAYEFGAAGATRPLVSTVLKKQESGCMNHSLVRSEYVASEMPQAFLYKAISKAYNKCTDHDLDFGTECLQLAQTYSDVNVRLVEGMDNLWKVTHKKDLYAAKHTIQTERINKGIILYGETHIKTELQAELLNDNIPLYHASNQDSYIDCVGLHPHVSYYILAAHTLTDADNLYQELSTKLGKLKESSTVLFLLSKSVNCELFIEFRALLKSIIKTNESVCLHGVLANSTSEAKEIVKLLVSLINNSTVHLSGQVFII